MTFSSAVPPEALSIVRDVLRPKEPITLAIMAPGCSGLTLVKVASVEKSYVIRFWNKRRLKYWPQDLACQLVASAAGYGPLVVFSDEQAAVSVMEFRAPVAGSVRRAASQTR